MASLHPANGDAAWAHPGLFRTALIPALNRLGMSPVGTFKLDIGPETPTYYVLIPSTSVETLLALDTLLGKDLEDKQTRNLHRNRPEK